MRRRVTIIATVFLALTVSGARAQDYTSVQLGRNSPALAELINWSDEFGKAVAYAGDLDGHGAGNNWTRINYADDLTIGPKTGRVYFTDGTYEDSLSRKDSKLLKKMINCCDCCL